MSPGLSTWAAGVPRSTLATLRVTVEEVTSPLESSSTQTITIAITMFTAGPAAMTTIRFQTAWL